ncbi:MAG: phospho-N-acetylmuramoyl-pentapeptide-transferase [Acetatifactor sp.]|nr:phospho-N-acetylmuramoyl-pentapeptide-transferase [Acetatifactor sp.]
MFELLINNMNISLLLGIIFSFVATFLCTLFLKERLPKDGGREFAHDGKLSKGKPRGAGIIFVLTFVAAGVLFGVLNLENVIYLVLLTICMLTGFFDDAAEKPWNEYKKGALDLVVSILVAVTFLYFNPAAVNLAIFGVAFSLHPIVYGILIVILVWVSVNVTNCSDGVDGLSGTLSIITMMSIYFLCNILDVAGEFTPLILFFVMALVAYLWFNATPSILMMGDAGSRAMGIFIAIAILKSGAPLLYIPVAIVLIIDGGLGLIKVSVIRFLHVHIMSRLRTPIHDHVRKVMNWSNTQCVYRFAIIQIVVSAITLYLVKI